MECDDEISQGLRMEAFKEVGWGYDTQGWKLLILMNFYYWKNKIINVCDLLFDERKNFLWIRDLNEEILVILWVLLVYIIIKRYELE